FHSKDPINASENAKIMQEICREVYEKPLVVAVDLSGIETPKTLTQNEIVVEREKDALWLEAENNVAVQQMLKTFRGKIVKVWRDEKSEGDESKN
ncbi:MAG: hypothetical protein H7Z37_18755, partial [Pyrinomonadaceae bacterium]|nr:hypothetical protein [Pyrinomonadaceae bacterium]